MSGKPLLILGSEWRSKSLKLLPSVKLLSLDSQREKSMIIISQNLISRVRGYKYMTITLTSQLVETAVFQYLLFFKVKFWHGALSKFCILFSYLSSPASIYIYILLHAETPHYRTSLPASVTWWNHQGSYETRVSLAKGLN